jgi:hypothetical protein
MRHLPALLLLLAAHYPAFAGLGETKAQIEARYVGTKQQPIPLFFPIPVTIEYPSRFSVSHYTSGDYKIAVLFINWTSAYEDFARLDGKNLTRDEIQKLLKADSLGSKWQEITDTGGNGEAAQWKLENGKAIADYGQRGDGQWTLTVKTQEYLNPASQGKR